MSLISKLSQHNLAYMIGAEVLGTNLPRIALTRTPQERLDVFTDEAASSVGFFGGGLVLDKWLEGVFKKHFMAGGDAARWARLGKTFGVGSVLFGMMVAVSYLRNYVTAQVNKTSQFSQIIKPQANAVDNRLEAEKQKAMGLAIMSLLGGILASLGSVWLAKRNIAAGVPWQRLNDSTLSHWLAKALPGKQAFKLGDWLDNRFLFGGPAFLKNPKNRDFSNMPNPAAFFFWTASTYLGYFTAARSPLERMEAFIKFLNFTGSFFFLPPFIEKKLIPAIQRTFPKLGKDAMDDVRFFVKQGAGIGSLVTTTMAYQSLSAHILNQGEKPPVAAVNLTRHQPVFATFKDDQPS